MSRSLLGMFAVLICAAPAFAHPGHGNSEGVAHYATEPVHVLPMMASIAVSGALLVAGYFAMGRLNSSSRQSAVEPVRVESESQSRVRRSL
ncbi:hypothetical protein LOC71_17250 [Rhodopirellula sp. JC740]|uniref:Uncharacterized protein n=1 Tax=Rhodopirellula halodulae TaxID=2894198 RepID=A0ABS8NM79_9BACT|nr:hypothetical protein [Rhodopirellula sp. JC740]MCC9644032.1 hypothetical protein [Rhodopirellula sp. JC740]